jgi:hypothetical protein
MAFAATWEWWSCEDAYAAADILKDYQSGSITSLVTGLRGEGNAINLPSTLARNCTAKQATAGGSEIIFHAYVQYNQDNNPILTVINSPQTAAVFSISSGTITVKRGDGTTIGSFAAGWGIGEKHWISFAITMANTATGKLKLWIDGTAVINTSSVQTVNTGGSTSATGVILNGLGVWDYIGCIIGSGGWVDSDVPLQKRVRCLMASAPGINQNFPGVGNWNLYGSGATPLAVVSENPIDATNGLSNTGGNGTLFDFVLGALAADTAFPIWGVQYVECAQIDSGAGRSFGFRMRDATSLTNGGGIPTAVASLTTSPLYYHMFYATNVRASAAWSAANYAATQIELTMS